jgi:hypothetical protein
VAAGIRFVDDPEPRSILIPYRNIVNTLIPFYRVRLASPRASGQKYTQDKKTALHIYVPPGGPRKLIYGEYGLSPQAILLTEGEFKTLSGHEAGLPIIGLPGLVLHLTKNQERPKLLPDLENVLEVGDYRQIYFIGDADTATNFAFVREASFLAQACPRLQVYLPRLPLNGPKGIDDLREELGPEKFPSHFEEILRQAIPLDPKLSPTGLALLLLEREANALKILKDVERERQFRRMVELCADAQLEDPQASSESTRLRRLVSDILGIGKRDLGTAVKERLKRKFEGQASPSTAPLQKDARPDRPELLLPVGDVEYTDTAKAVFPVLAKRHRYFIHGELVTELSPNILLKDKQYHSALQPLAPDALRSRIEQDFRCMAWRTGDGKPSKKPARCSRDTAMVLLHSDEAFELLAPLHILSAGPVLAAEAGKLRILTKGYHAMNGGIYVRGGNVILPTSLPEACKIILDLLVDYDFFTESDKSRAVAHFLSPALRAGQLLGADADFPLDLSEADVSQSGKTLRLRLVHAAYAELPYLIVYREGGVGSIDESISSALVAAKPFITIENYRGSLASQILETCLRGVGIVGARIPHRGECQLPTTHVNWQLSSNGMNGPLDFANRCIITRIRKRPTDYKFQPYAEGNVLAYTKARQPRILGAIFYIVMEWDRHGRPATNESRHDFLEWCRALDWMVQNLCELPPLLDGHTDELLRVSSPALSWLRKVALACQRQGRLNEGLLPREVADVCNEGAIELGKSDRIFSLEQQAMVAGRLLNAVFGEGKTYVIVDRFKVRRETRMEFDQISRVTRLKHYHWFELR